MDVRKWCYGIAYEHLKRSLPFAESAIMLAPGVADAFTPAITKLVEQAQACIDWEQEYRTLNHLGRNPPHPFQLLAVALAEFGGRIDG